MKNLLLTILLMFALPLSTNIYAAPEAVSDEVMKITQLREIADSLHSIGRTDSAVMVGAEAIRLAEKSGNPTLIVGTNAAQGVFLRSLGNIEGALNSYDVALAIITSGKFRENPGQEAIEEIASLYINLAVLNLDTQHKEQAAANAVSACGWIAKSTDAELRSKIYGVAGSVLTGCGDLPKALEYQTLAYRDALVSGNREAAFRAGAYNMLIADRLGNKQKAREWREICNDLLPSIDSMMAKLVYYQAECSICLKNNDSRGSLVWFNRILDMGGIDNLPFVKFDCYNNLHLAYADILDFEDAYNSLLKGNELRDSLWEIEKTESLRELTVKYETKETELALAKSEARRSTTLMWLFAALGLLLLASVGFVVYTSRQRRERMQREIEYERLRTDVGRQLTRQYIEGLESERSRMASELHDGVSNDLAGIQLSISNGQPIESVVRRIDECRESVRRISHELMPPEFAYSTLDEVLRYYVFRQREVNAGKIKMDYTSVIDKDDALVTPSDEMALEIYRIVQEAVGNAVRHSGASEIMVATHFSEEGIEVRIVDNGTFKVSRKKGIGLDSMRRRANSINGNIEMNQPVTGGTEVVLNVKAR